MDIEIFKAIILGIVQGITEFFPISSTAHLILLPWFFEWTGDLDTLTFDVALHGGTLFALIASFYKDWIEMLLTKRKMLLFILLATLPAGIIGILFNDFVEHTLRNPLIISVSLILFGILMLIAEKYTTTQKTHKKDPLLLDAITIGFAQAIALIPGVSRSGITIIAGLFKNLSRQRAARFSFLLSTPILAGATLLAGEKILANPASYNLNLFIVGFISSFISGIFAIKFLLHFLKNNPLNIFVYYRFILAVLIIAIYIKING